jgi:hypothetical protein
MQNVPITARIDVFAKVFIVKCKCDKSEKNNDRIKTFAEEFKKAKHAANMTIDE